MNKMLKSTATFALLVLLGMISEIYVGSSISWSVDSRLTTDPSDDWDPSIIQATDGKMWVTWHSYRPEDYNIFYKTLSGSSWSEDIQLTFDSSSDLHPAILQTTDGRIWIVWESERTGNPDLFYKTTSNNGLSWSGDVRLTDDPSRDGYPSIMQSSDGRIWVFWSSGRTVVPVATADIFYKVSSDGGQTWSADTLLETDYKNNYWDDLYPSCLQSTNGSIWVVWSKHGRELYYKIFNGTGWNWEVRLTTDPNVDAHPHMIQTANERIWVFWDSDRNKHDEDIYYKVLDNSWSNDTQLTTATEEDSWPSAVQASDLAIWVVWTSPRYPQLIYDIFYRTGMELHDGAVRSVLPSTLHNNDTLALREELVYISVEVENQGEGKDTFEVKAYVNSTLLGIKQRTIGARESYVLVFDWNTTSARPGIYVPSAVVTTIQGETDTSDNYAIGSLFEVRIKGDICGWYEGVLKPIPDRRVDIDDFGMVVGHFWTSSPTWHPVWGPAADLNGDGVVDIDDVMIVGLHYLET